MSEHHLSSQPGVLHLVGSFNQGGSERQALQTARLLKSSGRYRIRLACLSRQGVLRTEAASLFTDIPEYPLTSFYDRNTYAQLRRFVRMLRQERIAIVQTHDFYTNAFGMMASSMAGVPIRIAARRETGGVRTRAQRVVEHLAYAMAHLVVVNAAAVGDQLAREGVNRRKIAVVYNSLDFERVEANSNASREQALARLGVPASSSKRYVTIVANMRHPVKDHPTFLRAAKLVAADIPDAAFLLAGEGELQNSLRRVAEELGLEQHAHFLGRCESVADLLRISDVCVLSSRAEGFPNAVLEYMAAARPVVATDVGGVREAVIHGETGYITPVGDEQEMARRIVSLLQNPGQATVMGARGKSIVEQRFSCHAHLSRVEGLYSDLLANPEVKNGGRF